ncbi:hypothetical protein LguiB_024045 [Lonicera macranthoides]
MDFIGLDFSDKKQGRGLPPGLVPIADPYAEGDMPEVEIIIGDASKFGDRKALKPKANIEEEISEIYKMKVSTWGVSSSSQSSSADSSSPNSTNNNNSSESIETDTVKLAFEKAKAYKNSRQSISQDPVSELPNSTNDSSVPSQTDPVKLAFEKAEAYKNSIQSITRDPVLESPNSTNDSSESSQIDPVKLAFEEAKAYKKSIQSTTQNPVPEFSDNVENKDGNSNKVVPMAVKGQPNIQNPDSEYGEIGEEKDGSSNKEVPLAVKLAMERAKEYKQKKDVGGGTKTVEGGLKEEKSENWAITSIQKSKKRKDDPKISSIDFIGLDFADKKQSRGLPPGLVPIADPYAGGDLPEVEIIVGDASKFGDRKALKPKTNIEEENSDIYKPKVSTWGVFPRPRDISKTYGGGKTINPGDVLETEEEKAAKDTRAKQLVAAYKSQIGLKIDPKLKAECQKALNDGDSLMDRGKLKEALPFYEKVMDKLPFKTELHGLAALQWSICQDSLFRSNIARVMYEKLQSHPKVEVNKKARDFMFSFQAMEMMKVKSLSQSKTSTGYQNYFEAFVKDKSSTYPLIKKVEDAAAQVDEGEKYLSFISRPIFIFSYFLGLVSISI